MAVCFSEKILVFLSILVVSAIIYLVYRLKVFASPKIVVVGQNTSSQPQGPIVVTKRNDYDRFPVRNGDSGGLIGYIQSSSKNYPLYLTRNRMKRKFFYHINYSSDDNRLMLPIKVSNNDSEELYDSQEIFLSELSDTFRVNLYKDFHDV